MKTLSSVSVKYGIVCCFNRVFSLSQDFHIEHMNNTLFQSRLGCVFLSFWKACAGFLRKTRGRWGINTGCFKKYCIVLENVFCNYYNYVVIGYIPTQNSYSYAGGVLFIFFLFLFFAYSFYLPPPPPPPPPHISIRQHIANKAHGLAGAAVCTL